MTQFKHRDIQLVRCEMCKNPIYRHMFYCPEVGKKGTNAN